MLRITQHNMVRNSGWMTIGFALAGVFQAGYFLVVARALGADGLGAFAAGLAIVSVLAPFVGLGAKNILVMRTSREPAVFSEYFGTAIAAILSTGGLLALIALGVGYLVFRGSDVAAVLPWVAASELGTARITELVMHSYQAHERVRAAALVLVMNSGVQVMAAVLFLIAAPHRDAAHWAQWYFGASAIVAVLALASATRHLGLPGVGRQAAVTILRYGIFFSIGSASQTVYADIDKSMLARMDSVGVAGVYTGGYRVIVMMSTPILAFVFAANPRFFRDGERNAPDVWQLAQRARKVAVVYGVIVAALCLIAAPALPWVLGSSFKESTEVVRWLALLPLIQSVHLIYGNALMGVGRQALRSAMQVGTAGINAGLNLWLIPLYSWRGAAIATLCGEALLAVAMVVLLRRATRPLPFRPDEDEGLEFTLRVGGKEERD